MFNILTFQILMVNTGPARPVTTALLPHQPHLIIMLFNRFCCDYCHLRHYIIQCFIWNSEGPWCHLSLPDTLLTREAFPTPTLPNYRQGYNATVPRGFLSLLVMLSRCTNLSIARASPPCTSGSTNDRRRTRVIAMLRQGIGTRHREKFQCMH